MSLQSTLFLKGIHIYLVPEIFKVYAYAMICYEIFTNDKQFKDVTMYKLQHDVLNFKSQIPVSCIDLIESSWFQNQNDRIIFDQIVDILRSNSSFIIEL